MIITGIENAAKLLGWIKTRGGIAVWQSQNLSNPSGQWFTPALTEDGQPYGSPTWQAPRAEIVTDPSFITLETAEEVQRCKIAIKRGSGLSLVLTDGSTQRVRRIFDRLVKSHKWLSVFYHFEYDETVFMGVTKQQTLADWMKENEVPNAAI